MPEADLYLHAVVGRHRALDDDPRPERLRRQVEGMLRLWIFAPWVESISLSGSLPKGTALRDSDVDLLLSLSPSTPGPLAEIHSSLADCFRDFLPQARNVSLRIHVEGSSIDLVPARRRAGSAHYTLWQLRHSTWLQTDVAEQIRYVRSSSLTTEIRALKLWRKRNTLRFPSFLVELSAIRALEPHQPIAESFLNLLQFLSTDFPTARLTDPGNSNNIVSDLLTPEERVRISTTAQLSLRCASWVEIL
jgi:predicted nucleotidyltransferase